MQPSQRHGTRSDVGTACFIAVVSIVGGACSDEDDSTSIDPASAAPFDVEIRRSLVVTEEPILANFPLQRVMDALAAQAEVPGLTGIALFRQWWDTQNPKPGLGLGAHCDDQQSASLSPQLNGFAYDCRPAPAEGVQASCASFSDPACDYLPIGLFNRFDLASPDGARCGEYRIVYAKRSGQTDPQDRNLIIFEAAMLNPRPEQGLPGCAPLVQAWEHLSKLRNVKPRAMQLENIYFSGLGNFGPVVHIRNFGDNPLSAGQVRSNQFMGQASTLVWTLREFKLRKKCEASCALAFEPVTAKVNPAGLLFAPSGLDPRAAAFQAELLVQNASSLAADQLTDIAMLNDDLFNTAQSHTSRSREMDYLYHFGTEPSALRAQLEVQLATGISGLSPDDIVARAMTQTCAGCHQLSNGKELGAGKTWPPSLGFVHITEHEPELIDGMVSYRLSPALLAVFLPLRKQIMDSYLNGRPLWQRGKGATIGGRVTH